MGLETNGSLGVRGIGDLTLRRDVNPLSLEPCLSLAVPAPTTVKVMTLQMLMSAR